MLRIILCYLFVSPNLSLKSRRKPIRIVGVVIVRTTIGIHIAEVVAVVRIHRTQPPIAGKAVRFRPAFSHAVMLILSFNIFSYRCLSLEIKPRILAYASSAS